MPHNLAGDSYEAPAITYHGRVEELTLSHHVVAGTSAVKLAAAFASSVGSGPIVTPGEGAQGVPGVPGAPGGNGGTTVVHAPGSTHTIVREVSPGTGSGGVGGAQGSGGAHGAGAGAAGHGGGKELPFTGLAVVTVAGVGAALASAGGVIRRLTGRDEQEAA